MAASAPTTAAGTLSRMAMGRVQLSYRAARARYTNMIAMAYTTPPPRLALACWKDSPLHDVPTSAGSTLRAIASVRSITSPVEALLAAEIERGIDS